MKPYLSFLYARFRTQIQYRTAALAGVVTQVFWGFIKIMVLEAFYSASTAIQPMSFREVVSYVWLGQGFLALMPWNTDPDIGELIRTGSVSYELLRPLDLYSVWYVRTLAWRVAGAILRCIPLLLFAGPLLSLIGLNDIALALPPTIGTFLLWTLSMAITVVLGCSITSLSNVTMMWTISARGAASILPIFVIILSGMIVPLPLMPDWLVPVLRILPFSGLADTPFRIYSGNLAGMEALWAILHQIIWFVVLVSIGRYFIRRGTRRLVIQGG